LGATVTYEGGATRDVTSEVEWQPSGGTIDAGGTFDPPDVASDTSVTINATYSEGVQTVSASETVTVKYVPTVPQSLALSGPAEMKEGDVASFKATVTYNDGTTGDVTAQASWSASAGAITAIGEYTATDVLADTSITVTATFAANGVTVSGTAVVAVKDTLAKLVIKTTGNGESGLPATSVHLLGEEVSIPVPDAPSSGLVFAGWQGDVPAGHEMDNPLVVVMDGNKEISAQFITSGGGGNGACCSPGGAGVVSLLVMGLWATTQRSARGKKTSRRG
jgi:hypothetical protein